MTSLLLPFAAILASLGFAALGLSLPTIGALVFGVWPLNEFFDAADRPWLRRVGAILVGVAGLVGLAGILVS